MTSEPKVTEKVAHRALVSLARGEYKSQDEAYRYVVVFAKNFWFRDYTPEFEEFSHSTSELKRVGYLVDFLARFHHVSPQRKKGLREQLSKLVTLMATGSRFGNESAVCSDALSDRTEEQGSVKLTFYIEDKPDAFSFDEVAEKWGLSKGLHASKMRRLLDMQRRENLGRC